MFSTSILIPTLPSFPHYPVLIPTLPCPHSQSSFPHYPVLIPTLPCPHSHTTLSSFPHYPVLIPTYPVLIPTLPSPHSHTTLSSFPHYPVLIPTLPCPHSHSSANVLGKGGFGEVYKAMLRGQVRERGGMACDKRIQEIVNLGV